MQLHDRFGHGDLIAILRGIRPDEVIAVAEALIGEGVAIIEVPLNSPEPFASIRLLSEAFEGRILSGAGTVLRAADVDRVADAGGRLIVAPSLNAAVIECAKRRGLLAFPGVATPSEAFAALDHGADALKIFPAEGIPPRVLKAWHAVLPKGCLTIPVGGITADSLEPYHAAGAGGFGIGSALYAPGKLPDAVRAAARLFTDAARSCAIGPDR